MQCKSYNLLAIGVSRTMNIVATDALHNEGTRSRTTSVALHPEIWGLPASRWRDREGTQCKKLEDRYCPLFQKPYMSECSLIIAAVWNSLYRIAGVIYMSHGLHFWQATNMHTYTAPKRTSLHSPNHSKNLSSRRVPGF